MQLIRLRSVAILAVLGLVAFLAAGCGGGPAPSAVANIGTTTTSGTSDSTGTSKAADARAFSSCMRRNGVTNFPDPGQGGGLQLNKGNGLNPDSPLFQKAQSKCQKLLPNGGRPSAAEQAKAQAQALRYSACMRSHGVTKFPDPQFSNSGGGIRITIGPGSGLDPNSPLFKSAQKACQHVLPGLKTRSSSGGGPSQSFSNGGAKTGP